MGNVNVETQLTEGLKRAIIYIDYELVVKYVKDGARIDATTKGTISGKEITLLEYAKRIMNSQINKPLDVHAFDDSIKIYNYLLSNYEKKQLDNSVVSHSSNKKQMKL